MILTREKTIKCDGNDIVLVDGMNLKLSHLRDNEGTIEVAHSQNVTVTGLLRWEELSSEKQDAIKSKFEGKVGTDEIVESFISGTVLAELSGGGIMNPSIVQGFIDVGTFKVEVV